MPTESLNGLIFSGLAWAFQLPPSKHTKTSIWHCGPFTGAF